MGLRRNKKLKTKSTGESGGIQAPGACGPGLQGACPKSLGPNTQTTIFSQTSWREPGEGVGVG